MPASARNQQNHPAPHLEISLDLRDWTAVVCRSKRLARQRLSTNQTVDFGSFVCIIMDFVDYYELLEIEPTASEKEIKKAYKKALIKYHPDKNATTEAEIKECTKKTAQVNNAKDELLNPKKRAAYDVRYNDYKNPQYEDEEYKQRQEQHRPPEKPGGDYDKENERPLRKPKYVPGSTASPYRGPTSNPKVFYFSGDGTPGCNGNNGLDGNGGISFGQDGTDGRNATAPTSGTAGADYEIFLDTVQGNEGHLEISVLAAAGDEVASYGRQPEFTPIKLFQSVDFSSRGGKGGDGGNGGQGGAGARGFPGRDATRYSSGTNGGRGGDGGNGGSGTAGAHGGRGGYITYVLDEEDSYLLMRVGGVDPKEGAGTRVQGGSGGRSGIHGSGGRAGSGGPGGRSYSWTESYQRRDANGYIYTDYNTYTNSGGYSGVSGRRGATPTFPLYSGTDGDNGLVQIRLKTQKGETSIYDRRYDLAFQKSRHRHLSDMGESTFEFGEIVHITHLLLLNSGRMPTPRQRVVLSFGESFGVNPARDTRLLVARGLSTPPGEIVSANQGFLSFECPYPENGVRDFEPIRKEGWLKYGAVQLGPENKNAPLARLSDFNAAYSGLHNECSRDQLRMAFPIENQNGVRGVRSLAAKETTFVLLTVTNRSLQSFGRTSSTGRPLSVQFQYVQDDEYEIDLDQIRVRSQSGDIVSVEPGRRGDRGYKVDIPFLEAGSDCLVQVSFKLNTEADMVRPGAQAGLQAKIYLDDIPVLNPDGSSTPRQNPKRLIQSRLFEASCQPKFTITQDVDVVILTTTANKADQIDEWFKLVGRLGMSSQVYSVSRYGHVSPEEVVEGELLKGLLKGKLIVFLNEEYKPRPNDRQHRNHKARPTQLFNSPYDFDETTKFLMVGGKLNAVEQLTPDSDSYSVAKGCISIDATNRKEFKELIKSDIEDERCTGFAESPRSTPKKFTVQIKKSFFREPNRDRTERVLSKRCKKMQVWVNRQDNLRHDKVTWIAKSPEIVNESLLKNVWRIGELQITLGVPSTQKSVVWVSEEDGGKAHLSSPGAIKSNSMTHAVLSALSIEKRIDCFVKALRALGGDEDDLDAKTFAVVCRDCLVNDFLADIASYYHGRFKVEDTRVRSRTLRILSMHDELGNFIDECLGDDDLKAIAAEELGALVAALRCCATSLDLKPWWNPLSRKFSVCKAMREAVAELEANWFNIFDEEKVKGMTKSIRDEAKKHIKEDRKKTWLRARGRYRAALEHLHSPTNVRKYPANREFGPNSARIRDEHTMTTGKSRKRKKCKTTVRTPENMHEALSTVTRRLDFTDQVRQTTILDDEGYRQTVVELAEEV